jgi:hypothetical protein
MVRPYDVTPPAAGLKASTFPAFPTLSSPYSLAFVIAPSAADETSAAYLAKTPLR